MNTGKVEKKSTLGSALIILLLVAIIAAAVIFLILNPGLIGNLLAIAVIAIIVIVAIVIIIFVVMALLALPLYVMKGETYQTDASYDLDDVRSVKEKDSEKKDEP